MRELIDLRKRCLKEKVLNEWESLISRLPKQTDTRSLHAYIGGMQMFRLMLARRTTAEVADDLASSPFYELADSERKILKDLLVKEMDAFMDYIQDTDTAVKDGYSFIKEPSRRLYGIIGKLIDNSAAVNKEECKYYFNGAFRKFLYITIAIHDYLFIMECYGKEAKDESK